MVFYFFLFTVPTIGAFIYTGGRTQLSREELLQSAAYREKVCCARACGSIFVRSRSRT